MAIPLDRKDNAFQTGVYVELAVTPAINHSATLRPSPSPLPSARASTDTMGPETTPACKARAAINLAIPLSVIPSSYGRWSLSLGGHVVARDNDIRRLSSFDGKDNVILFGRVMLGFTY